MESSRLTAALGLFLGSRSRGEDPRALIARHPDLADLLEPMCAEDEQEPVRDDSTFGDFRLGRQVGRGGMGVVYQARQLSLDRRVALKILAPEVATNPTQIARFQREARTLARLDHQNIVRVLDVGEDNGQHWLAMEFVEGESLEQHLSRISAHAGHSGKSRRALVEAIVEIADALQHVHDAGILHRDVKPSNILLERSGRARLTDFGLARDAQAPAMTQVGVVAGTPHYMSPEHLTGGDALRAHSDVFSLGATLYECMVLRRAFDGETTDQVLRDIVLRDPIDPRRVDPSVAKDLTAIILKALEKDPARRYPTARAFGDDLRAFLDLRPVQARPPSRWLRLQRWVRREPLQAALVGVMGALALLATLFLVQLPAVRAADLARREQAYEDAITAGDLERAGGDKQAALAAFDRARNLFPERNEAVVWHCLALSQLDGAEPALRELTSSCGTASGDETVEGLRAYLFTALGRAEEAAALTQRIGAPTTPTGMLLAATTLLRRGQPGDLYRASQLMSLAVRMSKQPRLFLYACWAGVAPPEQRQECADAILALWPDHPLALQQAALCLGPSDPARAAALMRRAIDRGVVSQNAHQLLAAMAWRAGDRTTAVASARESLAKDQLDDELRTKLIDQILRVVDPGIAEVETTAWLEREPTNAAALRLHAAELNGNGDPHAALELLQRALLTTPDDPDLENERALLLWRTQDPAQAVACTRAVLEAHPTHAGAHRTLTLLCRERADAAGLLAEQRRWVSVRNDDAQAWQALASTLLDAATPEALAEALHAIATADYLTGGKDARVLELRARVHEALGETAAAAQCRDRLGTLPTKKE